MAPQASKVKVILGAGNVGDKSIDPIARFDTPAEVNAYLNAFAARGHNTIDTARVYSPHAPGSSEPRLGAVEAGKRFIIDTKVMSRGSEHPHSRELIAKSVDDSLAALEISKINVEYLHKPDRTTPFEETCEALDKAYRQGKFERFGLSNYTAAEVEEIVQICTRRGFVKPSVYQGQYNPLVRSGEKELFPVLRKHGISFYAYSPAAGGFFAGNAKHAKAGGRFDTSHLIGQHYNKFYSKPSIQTAVDKVVSLTTAHKISGHAAATRWTTYHSLLDAEHDDALIIGSSSVEQLNTNLDAYDAGPLPDELAEAVGDLFREIEADSVPYHS